MGWADCGRDSRDRRIGYAFSATCDHRGCKAKIHRGLAYACGGMHGDGDGYGCEGYFCEAHRQGQAPDADGRMRAVCMACEAQWRREEPEQCLAWDEHGHEPGDTIADIVARDERRLFFDAMIKREKGDG